MKPASFKYFAPREIDELLQLLAEHGDNCRILAGGQSLVPMLNMRIVQPEVLVSINHCKALDYVNALPSFVSFGAGARQVAGQEAGIVRELCPLMVKTLPLVGSSSTRNRGTVCGSLAHADPLAELTATAVALDAEFILSSQQGQRVVGASEFFVSALNTCIEPGEFLEQVRFPSAPADARCAFVESGNRKHGFALVGIAAQFRIDEAGRCQDVRLSGIGMGDGPVRLSESETIMTGNAPSRSLFMAAGDAASRRSEAESDIHADAHYRRSLAGVLMTRALDEALNSDLESVHHV